jgi:hypothetical protein
MWCVRLCVIVRVHACVCGHMQRYDTAGEITYGHDYSAGQCAPTSTGAPHNGKLRKMDYDGWAGLVHQVSNQLECRLGGFNVKLDNTAMRLGNKFRIGMCVRPDADVPLPPITSQPRTYARTHTRARTRAHTHTHIYTHTHTHTHARTHARTHTRAHTHT